MSETLPEIPSNTIHGTIWSIERRVPEIIKPARGLFLLAKFKEQGAVPPVEQQAPKSKISEEEFYAPFAEFLVKELEECTKAIPIGRNKSKDKWGTPDVIGVLKPRPSDILSFPQEIISAEIKVDDASLITALSAFPSVHLPFAIFHFLWLRLFSGRGDSRKNELAGT